jgi:hypothetical protein
MLAQVLLGGVMHVLDFLSDLYVLLLWHWGGRGAFVAAGVAFIACSTCFSGLAGFNWLRRYPDKYGRARWAFLALLPCNVHTMVFGALALRDRADAFAWECFVFLRGLHGGVWSPSRSPSWSPSSCCPPPTAAAAAPRWARPSSGRRWRCRASRLRLRAACRARRPAR